MKHFRLVPAILLASILIITGCGKSKDHQTMESEFDAEVASIHKDLESSLSSFAGLQTQLDEALRTHNELRKRYARMMKNHNADDIKAAKQGLAAAKSEAETAIGSLAAYDKKMDHDKAMQMLNGNKELLTNAKERVAVAIDAANAAIANHEQMKEQLTKKRR